jgi:hypothetical protein
VSEIPISSLCSFQTRSPWPAARRPKIINPLMNSLLNLPFPVEFIINDDSRTEAGRCTLSAHCLHVVCTLSAHCLHIVCTLSAP